MEIHSSLTRMLVPKPLPSAAGHYLLRQSKLSASGRKLSDMPMALPLGATATTAASGGNREELLGQRPAGCKRQRSRRWEPQPGQWHCEAMTERASPARKSRCAAMGRLFVRAILSSRSRFFVSILALSGAPRQLSQRESPWHIGQVSPGRAKFICFVDCSALLSRPAAA